MISKPILIIAAVFGSAALFFAALIWQDALLLPQALKYVFAAVGMVCLGAVFVVGYGAVDDKAAMRPNSASPNEDRSKPVLYETVSMFGKELEDSIEREAAGFYPICNGLELAWEAEDIACSVEVSEFPAVIGREASCDIVIAARSVSRRHAELSSDEDEYFIEDLGSSNGTFVDGAKISGKARLTESSVLKVGGIHVAVKEMN